MLQYRYYNNRKVNTVNNAPITYDDYIIWDNEYRIYEDLMDLRTMYIDSIDKDDMDYPPMDWESGI
jgi:hypothetical protein